MKKKFQIFLTVAFIALLANPLFSQGKITKDQLMGSWTLKSGTGDDFDKGTIGSVFSFKAEDKMSMMEKGSTETMEGGWSLNGDILTFISYYEGEIFDKQELSVTNFDGKQLSLFVKKEKYNLVFEKKN